MKFFKLFEEDEFTNPMDIQYTNSPWSMMEPLAELGDFEPQQRARSNTWPLPRPENYVDPPDMVDDGSGVFNNSNKCLPPTLLQHQMTGSTSGTGGIIGSGGSSIQTTTNMPPTTIGGSSAVGACLPAALAATKKNSSRRNAWGNLSYADLITQAITSAPDNRLTLSQIYEWMVSNVPYFKDKGDSNSSAGWKNSIRHNLSLHNRFMRVQNEGTGKSSWWMINPDAKPGKSVRRRAASMETSKFEKRRGRVKKKVEALRNGLTADATPSPSSSVSEGLDMFPESPLHSDLLSISATGFQLSPDFRPRASSAASSCGRLSPIPAVVGVEPDWSSPSQYNSGYVNDSMVSNQGSYSPDQLAGNLEQGMKIDPDAYLQGYVNGQSNAPPPYTTAPSFEPTFPTSAQTHRDLASLSNQNSQQYHGGVLPSQCPIHRLQACSCLNPVICKIENISPNMSPNYPQSEPSPDPLSNHTFIMGTTSIDPTTPSTPTSQTSSNRPSSSSPPLTPQPSTQQTLAQQIQASTMMGQLMGALNNSTLLDDLNLNIETLHGGFDCNVDEVIKHELSMEGSLDFNFVTGQQSNQILPGYHQHDLQVQGVNQQQLVSSGVQQTLGQSVASGSSVTYSTASSVVTPPSWVH